MGIHECHRGPMIYMAEYAAIGPYSVSALIGCICFMKNKLLKIRGTALLS